MLLSVKYALTFGGRDTAGECWIFPGMSNPAALLGGRRQAMVQRKRVPRPMPSDSAHMCPPMASASFWLIARPSPDPPYLLVGEASTCSSVCLNH